MKPTKTSTIVTGCFFFLNIELFIHPNRGLKLFKIDKKIVNFNYLDRVSFIMPSISLREKAQIKVFHCNQIFNTGNSRFIHHLENIWNNRWRTKSTIFSKYVFSTRIESLVTLRAYV